MLKCNFYSFYYFQTLDAVATNVSGGLFQLNADMFEEAVLTEIMKQTPNIQRSIYKVR